MSPPKGINWSVSRVYSVANPPPDEILCSGASGDHSSCALKSNLYYAAAPEELCKSTDVYTDTSLLVTPTQWVDTYRPCMTWGQNPTTGLPKYVFSQPSSSFFVLFLAIGCMWVGRQFRLAWQRRDSNNKTFELSRLLWSGAMTSWGAGAFLAGLSYEALEWHLKCTSPAKSYCLQFSWLEIAYVILQVAACDVILLAVAFSSQVTSPRWFLVAVYVAAVDFLMYVCLVAVGALLGHVFFLSFEFCLIMGGIPMLGALLINIGSYLKLRFGTNTGIAVVPAAMEAQRRMVVSWVLMVISGVAYYLYLETGIQYKLWCDYRIWATANDVLHILLLAWLWSLQAQADGIRDSRFVRNSLSTMLFIPPAVPVHQD